MADATIEIQRPRVPSAPERALRGIGDAGINGLAALGEHLGFYVRALGDIPFALRRRSEIIRHISDITIGAGALIAGAGTAGVIFFMAFFTGTQVGLEGFKGLELIGAEAFTGFVSAFANTREITPLIAGVTLAAQVGAGFTAEIGAMRVNEEIDALEVMAVRPVPYLVSTRIIAALVAILPLYLVSLFASYFRDRRHRDAVLGPVARSLRSLPQPVAASHRHPVLADQGVHLRHHSRPHPLLLRVQREGRAGRSRDRRRKGDPHVHSRRERHEPHALGVHVGHL